MIVLLLLGTFQPEDTTVFTVLKTLISPVPISTEIEIGRVSQRNLSTDKLAQNGNSQITLTQTQNFAKASSPGLSAALIGFVGAMLVYNLFLFVVTRERLHLFYCLSAFGSVVYLLALGETLGTFHNVDLKTISCSVLCITQLIAITELLEIRKYQPRLYTINYLLSGLLLASAMLLQENRFIMAFPVVVSTYILILVKNLSANKKLLYTTLLTWIPFLIAFTQHGVINSGIIPADEPMHTQVIMVAVAWQTIVFSATVGYRCGESKLTLLKVQQEKIQSIDEQKGQLKRIILDNTEEIMTQNEALIKTQDLINRQNQKLEAQNKAYEKLRQLVLRQNQNLELAVKKRTVELATANDQLKETVQKLDRFSNITAHNLRGPLARILGLCMLFDQHDLPQESNNAQIIAKLQSSAMELDTIIRDIGTILSIQTTKGVEREAIALRDLFAKIRNSFGALNDNRFQIDFQTEAEQINAVPEYLGSIFSNLISNSIKFKRNGMAQIHVRIMDCKEYTVFHYRDNGFGFDSDRFKDKIFEPYQRFHAHSEGKGLGLFLVRAQVTAMGGTINLWSRENQGVRIKIILPNTNILPDSDHHAGDLPPRDPVHTSPGR